MSFGDRVRASVKESARQRLIREIDRALASGLTEQDFHELAVIAQGLRRDERRS